VREVGEPDAESLGDRSESGAPRDGQRAAESGGVAVGNDGSRVDEPPGHGPEHGRVSRHGPLGFAGNEQVRLQQDRLTGRGEPLDPAEQLDSSIDGRLHLLRLVRRTTDQRDDRSRPVPSTSLVHAPSAGLA